MQYDFPTEYSYRTDDELLHLASSRYSLVPGAAAALDAELHRRNLTESDRMEHRRHYKRQERLQVRKPRHFTFGVLKDRMTWRDILGAFGVIAVILFAYLALPRRYHMPSDWEGAALFVVMTSVLIVAASRRMLLRNLAFWISLIIACAIHLIVIHACTQRITDLNRNQGRGVIVIGFFLFLAVYKFISILQRNFYSKETSGTSQIRQVN